MPMMPHIRRLAAALACVVAMSVAVRADDVSTREAISRELAHASLDHGWTGILVKSLKDGRTIFARNEDRLYIPASNNKLLVSAAVTDTLGPDYRYVTPVMRDGEVKDGVLQGSLYLKGSGDSTLEGKDLKELAKAVKAAGIARVTGDIVGDGSIFDDRRLGDSWCWDDLAAYYSAEIDGLTVDRGTAVVRVQPGDVGTPPIVSILPDAGYLLVRNKANTVPDSEKDTHVVDRPMATNVVEVTGNVRRGAKNNDVPVSVEEPALYTAYLFRLMLTEEGVVVEGSPKRGKTPSGAAVVASHTSPPMSDILALLNKPSDNLIAESLVKTLGAVKKGEGSFAAGAEVERAWLKSIGVADTEWMPMDGSGLSRLNLVTPRAMLALLEAMWKHPNAKMFIDSLPVGGVDGSIRNRMKGTPAAGNVKAKTGYVGKARTLSGYVTSAAGEPLAFSFMMNHYAGQTSEINAVQDRIAVILASSTP